MRSERHGTHISGVEVTNISRHGFWILIGDRELILTFKDFPWFRDVPVGQLLNVKWPHPHHLYWPDLDVDLAVESIEHPKRFPLLSKIAPNHNNQTRRIRKR